MVVNCSPKDAFHYFTGDFDNWWPGETHSCIASASKGASAPAACIIEPRLGGRVYERGDDGKEYDWGVIEVWEPPSKLAFTWHPGRGPETAQRVEVEFSPDANGTRVVLTHTGWERLGETGAETREEYNSGWDVVFTEKFGGYVKSKTG
jgi:uncharacterized protein YndB with AHSA1/START domain